MFEKKWLKKTRKFKNLKSLKIIYFYNSFLNQINSLRLILNNNIENINNIINLKYIINLDIISY